MAAAAHDPEFAAKAGIPQRVAREFHAADKRKAKGKGRLTKAINDAMDKHGM